MDNTNYFFYVSPDHFVGALDRFTQSFLEPLFDSSCSEREIKAVDGKRKFIPFNPIPKRITAEVEKDGKQYIATKGASNAILKLCAPDAETATQCQKVANDFASRDFCSLGVAMNTDGQWKLLDLLPVFDPPRSDTAATTAEAQSLGILVKMLTGDAVAIAKETFKMHQHHGHLTAITGDGVNHVHSLKKADCGIAVKGASDAAQSAADVVFLDEGISTIITLIKKLVKWQSTHDNNLSTSKDRDAFLKLQNVYRMRKLQDLAQFKQLVGETCKSAEAFVKHAGYLKLICGRSKKRCSGTQAFTVSSHHLDRAQPALDFNLTTGACIATLPMLRGQRYNNRRGRFTNGDWLLSLSSMLLRGAVTTKVALSLATPLLQMVGQSNAAETVSVISRGSSVAVSGTPVKKLDDLKSCFHFLCVPGYHASSSEWQAILHPVLAPALIHVSRIIGTHHTKAQVASKMSLPLQTQCAIPINFTLIEAAFYTDVWKDALDDIGYGSEGSPRLNDHQIHMAKMCNQLLLLRQACTHLQVALQFRGNVVESRNL
ncbi:hypothetical protein NDA13_003490 [Ustilago tritici]|nr:hypothetical protein NDA13_003490 [Ustilago tritici]